MHRLAAHFEKRRSFRSMTQDYASATLRDFYGVVEFYRSLSLDFWLINLERGLQLRCGRRELDEATGHPFFFLTFQKRDIKLQRTDCDDYLGAPYCPHNQLLGPDTLPQIHRHNRKPGELPAILHARGPRPGHLPDSYPKQPARAPLSTLHAGA